MGMEVAEQNEESAYALLRDGSGDLLLSIVSYLNAKDGAMFAMTCRRAYFWVHSYRKLRGPEFIACAASSSQGTVRGSRAQPLSNEALVTEALDRIQAPPNLCLAFHTNRNPSFPASLPSRLPPSTLVLGVRSTDIQSVLGGVAECDSSASLFLGTLPESSHALPFCWHLPEDASELDCPEWTDQQFLTSLLVADPTYWKVMLVYSTHGASDEVANFVHKVQDAFPTLQIAGGICNAGFVSQPHSANNNWNEWRNHDLVAYLKNMGVSDPKATNHAALVQQAQEETQKRPYHLRYINETNPMAYGNGIFGVVLGGDVPVQTVVSRGVNSNLSRGPPTPASDFVVQEAEYFRPSEEGYIFSGPPGELPSYHMLRSIRNVRTGETVSVPRWLSGYGAHDLVGLRQPGQDGFCLHTSHPLSRNLGGLLFFQDSTLPTAPMTNYEIDLYSLDGKACRDDVHSTLQALQEEVSEKQLLGACMFSCLARGPSPGMLGERMADASAWAQYFPTVPLLGWYAGGEIGPTAMAGRQRALRGRDEKQRATLQGFTAVFALWIVPLVDWKSIQLDDAADTVKAFCREHLLGGRRNVK